MNLKSTIVLFVVVTVLSFSLFTLFTFAVNFIHRCSATGTGILCILTKENAQYSGETRKSSKRLPGKFRRRTSYIQEKVWLVGGGQVGGARGSRKGVNWVLKVRTNLTITFRIRIF